MSIYIPYTYLIGWTQHNKWYYGVQYGKKANPKNLWSTYFTSSNYVKRLMKDLGNPDVVQVRQCFNSADKARVWEEKVITRLQQNSRLINQFVSNKFFNPGGIIPSNDTKIKMSLSHKGKITWNKGIKGYKRKSHNHATKNKISDSLKDFYSYNNNPMLGKTHSKETRDKISLKKTGSLGPKKCVMIEDTQFESCSAAAKFYNVSAGTISYWVSTGKAKILLKSNTLH